MGQYRERMSEASETDVCGFKDANSRFAAGDRAILFIARESELGQ